MSQLNAQAPIVEESGFPSQTMREWAVIVARTIPIIGTGSPEGAIEAPQYSLYIDETVPLAPVQYRKMLANIGGDKKQGWAVV